MVICSTTRTVTLEVVAGIGGKNKMLSVGNRLEILCDKKQITLTFYATFCDFIIISK